MKFKVVTLKNSRGDDEVHLDGCQHVRSLAPYNYGYRPGKDVQGWTDEVEDRMQIAEANYGRSAGSFFEEDGGDPDASNDSAEYREFLERVVTGYLHFAPCTNHIPLRAKPVAERVGDGTLLMHLEPAKTEQPEALEGKIRPGVVDRISLPLIGQTEADLLMDLLNAELRKSNSIGQTVVRKFRERLMDQMIKAGWNQ